MGEFRGMAEIGLETGYVRDMGHLAVFRKGYLDFGSGMPEAYSISDYPALLQLIAKDRELAPLLNVVTPSVSLGGIAGNTATDTSKTFFATGLVPSDRDKMRRWDEYRLYTGERLAPYPLSDDIIDHGVVGKGLAHILGLCAEACSTLPTSARLELLSGSRGAPNIVVFYANTAQSQGAKEMDDSYIAMHLALAQRLLYGNSPGKVSSIILQLKRTEDVTAAKARLEKLLTAHKLDLEVHDFMELSPSFSAIMSALRTMFSFVSVILGIILIFTIANTMGMNVMERINEIGTARAMGTRRSRVRQQFLLEGVMIGGFGATAGIALAKALTYGINHADISYHMPISTSPIPLYLMTDHNGGLLVTIWLALVLIAAVASIFPANRAAGMKVVDALRHV